MDARDFKARFAAATGEVPDWADFDPSEFVTFDPHVLRLDLLSRIGMPRSSAPMLDFCALQTDEVAALRETFEIPNAFFPIGHNKPVLIEGYTSEEILAVPDEQLDAFVLTRIARRRTLKEIEWLVHATNCARPNPKLRRVLERRGFEVVQHPQRGACYRKLEAVNEA